MQKKDKPKKKANVKPKNEKAKPRSKKKTVVKQRKKNKAKEESQREAEERKEEAEAEAKEVFKEEGYEKQVKTRKEVRMMYSRVDWLGVMLDKSFIIIFLKETHIFYTYI